MSALKNIDHQDKRFDSYDGTKIVNYFRIVLRTYQTISTSDTDCDDKLSMVSTSLWNKMASGTQRSNIARQESKPKQMRKNL